MANWCENNLSVSGNRAELNRFKEFAKGENGLLDMEKFIPYPKKYKVLYDKAEEYQKDGSPITDGYNSGGREWCISNWGTKCNFCEINLSEGPKSLYYTFTTAWSPPTRVIQRMGRMFPKLNFYLSYYEGGNAFQGRFVMRKGKVQLDLSMEYKGYKGG